MKILQGIGDCLATCAIRNYDIKEVVEDLSVFNVVPGVTGS